MHAVIHAVLLLCSCRHQPARCDILIAFISRVSCLPHPACPFMFNLFTYFFICRFMHIWFHLRRIYSMFKWKRFPLIPSRAFLNFIHSWFLILNSRSSFVFETNAPLVSPDHLCSVEALQEQPVWWRPGAIGDQWASCEHRSWVPCQLFFWFSWGRFWVFCARNVKTWHWFWTVICCSFFLLLSSMVFKRSWIFACIVKGRGSERNISSSFLWIYGYVLIC